MYFHSVVCINIPFGDIKENSFTKIYLFIVNRFIQSYI